MGTRAAAFLLLIVGIVGPVTADAPIAILVGDWAMVPMRAVFEWLNATVTYSGGRITAVRGTDTVCLTVGSTQASVNGRAVVLPTPPVLRDDTTYVPLRFVAESMGAGVEYDGQGREVVVRESGRVLSIPIAGSGPWPTYTGRMFSIKYPPQFIPRAGDRPDSAYFRSPDGLVEFYVYSAYFTAEKDEYKIKRDGEVLVLREVQRTELQTIVHVTVKAVNGSYIRSYADILDRGSGRRVIGLKYRSQQAYQTYRPTYLKFKSSLEQYAD